MWGGGEPRNGPKWGVGGELGMALNGGGNVEMALNGGGGGISTFLPYFFSR